MFCVYKLFFCSTLYTIWDLLALDPLISNNNSTLYLFFKKVVGHKGNEAEFGPAESIFVLSCFIRKAKSFWDAFQAMPSATLWYRTMWRQFPRSLMLLCLCRGTDGILFYAAFPSLCMMQSLAAILEQVALLSHKVKITSSSGIKDRHHRCGHCQRSGLLSPESPFIRQQHSVSRVQLVLTVFPGAGGAEVWAICEWLFHGSLAPSYIDRTGKTGLQM